MFQPSSTQPLVGKVIIVSNSGLELGNPEVVQDDTGILVVASRSNLLTASKVDVTTLLAPDSVIKTGAATGDSTFMETSVPSLQVLANAEVTIGTQFGVPFFKVTAKGKDHYHRCGDVAIHVFPSTESGEAQAPAEVPAAAPATAAPARRGRGGKAAAAEAAPAAPVAALIRQLLRPLLTSRLLPQLAVVVARPLPQLRLPKLTRLLLPHRLPLRMPLPRLLPRLLKRRLPPLPALAAVALPLPQPNAS